MLIWIHGDNLVTSDTKVRWHLSPDDGHTLGTIEPVEPDLLGTWGVSHLVEMKVRFCSNCVCALLSCNFHMKAADV